MPPYAPHRRHKKSAHDMPALVRLLDFGVLSPAAELAATTPRYFDRSGICNGRLQHVSRVRVLLRLCKDKKTGGNFKEIDLLGRQIERLARVRLYQEPGTTRPTRSGRAVFATH